MVGTRLGSAMPSDTSAPVVSIVTPAYNAARFISETIESVLAQTYEQWELLIVDDHSRDATREIVSRYARADHRIHLETSPRNQGPGPTRNQALALARGRYIAFLDSDDLWDPAKLDRQLGFMRAGRHAFTYTSYRAITEDGTVLRDVTIPSRMTYRDLLKWTAIGCLTVVLDRTQLENIEFSALKTNQDLVLWLSLLKRGVVAQGLPEVLASYRLVNTSNTANKFKSARNVWRVYRRIEKLSLPAAAWCFSHYALHAALKHRAFRGSSLATPRHR
jgi:teichuronic acid biosynthesis glycosyltransferase TuaG